jgi:hypothetical protein
MQAWCEPVVVAAYARSGHETRVRCGGHRRQVDGRAASPLLLFSMPGGAAATSTGRGPGGRGLEYGWGRRLPVTETAMRGSSRRWPQPSAARIEKQVRATLPADSRAGNVMWRPPVVGLSPTRPTCGTCQQPGGTRQPGSTRCCSAARTGSQTSSASSRESALSTSSISRRIVHPPGVGLISQVR